MPDDDETEILSTVVDLDSYRQQNSPEEPLLPEEFTAEDVIQAIDLRIKRSDRKTEQATWQALVDRRDIGLILIEARDDESVIPPGQWEIWIAEHTALARSTAQQYVRLASKWDEILPALESERALQWQIGGEWLWPNAGDAIAIWQSYQTRGAETERTRAAPAERHAAKKDASVLGGLHKRELQDHAKKLAMENFKLKMEIAALLKKIGDQEFEIQGLRLRLAAYEPESETYTMGQSIEQPGRRLHHDEAGTPRRSAGNSGT
jgi:hypothetical protein